MEIQMENAMNPTYVMSEDIETKMWGNAIFIFDSSAILDLYFLPKVKRKEVFDSFRTKMKDRLWLPSHVIFEYQKNRSKVIRKPITEKYRPLKEQNIQAITKLMNDAEKKVVDIQNQTKNGDKHPHLPQENIDHYINAIKEFKTKSEFLLKSISDDIDNAEKEISDLPSSDDVLMAINELYKVGRTYSFSEIIEITKEGKHRYEFTIPPGYEDLKDKDKKGIQIFGDLIIWKQIIEYANESKRPLVFVCNDLKEDWCYLDEGSTEKRIDRPREELVKEIFDEAGVGFWMYNLAQFLYMSNKHIKTEIGAKTINDIGQLINNRESEQSLILKCDHCGRTSTYRKNEFSLDFENVGSDSRSMGEETEYEAVESVNCLNCENQIAIAFRVWEYPDGCHNHDDVELEGATLIRCFSFTIDFSDNEEYYDYDDFR